MVATLQRPEAIALRHRASASSPPSPPRSRGLLRRVVRFLRDVLPAVAVYAGIRLAGLVALVIVADHLGIDAGQRLRTFDADWLLRLAQDGYDPLVPPATASNPHALSNVAFFPLYPGLVRLVATVTGLDVLAAGFTVTALAGAAAAVGVDRFGRLLPGGRRAGLILVALWACWPHSIVLAMPYTEALFVALAAWSLVAVLTRHWIAAGVLALLAGATRPLGIALAGALVVAALVAVVQGLVRERRFLWRPVAGAVLAPLGFLGYWGWLRWRTGRSDAWFWVQDHEWHSTFDGGRFTVHAVERAAYGELPLVLLVNVLVVVAAVVLLLALLAERPPLAVALYALLGTLTVVGAAGYTQSKARFLLCLFPLLVPLARVLARAPWRTTLVLLAGSVVVSAWYNAFVVTVWQSSP